jgi:ATP-dependent Clp protease ATP-binding subunit ClpA
MLDEYKEPLAGRGIRFGYSQETCVFIANKAFGKKAGARDVRDVIRREIEDTLTSLLLEHGDSPPALLSVTVNGEALKFEMA